MKKFKRSGYKPKLAITLLAGILFSGTAEAQYFEKSRHISKSFPVSAETEIQVSNKYGKVHLMPWEKDSVRFDIDFTAKAKKESKVDKIFNYIDFSFTNTRYYVIAQTEINKSTFWTEISDATSALFSSDNKAQIDYTVYYPKKTSIKITNKFGNIYVTDHTGKIDIQLSNGDLKAHDFTGETKINLEFGNASVNHITNGDLIIDYAEFFLQDARKISVNSKSSTINIEKVSEMNVVSRRDKFNIKQVEAINGESSFSNYRISEASKAIVLKMDYGEFYLENLLPKFSLLNLNGNYTDIQLAFPKSFSFDLEIDHDKRTLISYPETFKEIQKQAKDPEQEFFVTYGQVGPSTTRLAKIKLANSAGSISIRTN